MLIDSTSVKTEEQYPVYNPYTGEIIEKVHLGTEEDAKNAVASSKRACEKSRELTPHDRYEILISIYEQIEERKEELAELITRENGKPIKNSRTEVERALQTILFSAEEAKRLNGESLPADVTPVKTNKKTFTVPEPLGVIGAITPFNYPLNLVAHKVGPAIAAGNSVVLKPAPQTPLTAHEFGKMFVEAGAPDGLLNIVNGDEAVGNALVESDVEMISFTGSVKTGEKVASNSGMKKLSLELGGNGPLIIMDDADIEAAVETAVDASFGTAGQRCTAAKRILLHDTVADEFISEFVKRTKRLEIGDPLDEKTDVGPLISEEAAIDIEKRVAKTIEDGADLLLGGEREEAVYWPTILDNVPEDTHMVRTETFGPTAPIIRIDSLKEGVEVSNSTPYGLQAGVYTESLFNMKYATENLQSGAVIINESPGFRIETLPFGGTKKSGLGREGVKYAIEEMTEPKTVVF